MKVYLTSFWFLSASLLTIVAAETCVTSYIVNNTNDSGVGSIRHGIANVCSGGTITFASALTGKTIVLSGELFVSNKALTILGPGPDRLAISGNGNGRVFHVSYSPPGTAVFLAGLTITNGKHVGLSGPTYGGGILNEYSGSSSSLCVSNCAITGNKQGGIGNVFGSLAVQNCTINGNSGAPGIANVAGIVTIQNSTISGNSSVPFGAGGVWSTVAAGRASGSIMLLGCTITGNRPAGLGAVTITGFQRMTNCIVAGNFNIDGTAHNDIGGSFMASHNLIGNVSGTPPIISILDTNLANNGGPTLTHRLVSGSPALNAGSNYAGQEIFDQRGPGFYRSVGGRVDIGAYEHQGPWISNVQMVPNGVLVRVFGTPNQPLEIQWNTGVGLDGWNFLTDGVADSASMVQFVDIEAQAQPKRFYRALAR